MRRFGLLISLIATVTACSGDVIAPGDCIGVACVDAGGGTDAAQPSTDAAPQDDSANPTSPDASREDAAGGQDAAGGEDAGETADVAPEVDAEQPEDGPVVIYLAPNGNDSRSGESEAQAIRTLTRAHELTAPVIATRDVEIRVTAGTYYAQKVTWTATDPDHSIRITRWPLDGDRPVFDGCVSANGACPGGTWFILSHARGEETNLDFNYIHVKRYQTAISLNGGRNSESASNGSNRIFGNMFEDIGNEFNTSLDPSTAALRLVNSDDNYIVNNHFVDVVNTRSGALIHAIYAAHMSDRNQILRNRFKRSTGDPVRVRDYSNDNIINENRFIRVGTAAGYTDWYCDHDARNDCTKVGPECPSWRNQFRDNLLDGKYNCTALGTFQYFQGDSTTGCSPPSAGARRLNTSGNTQHSPPCGSE